MTVCANFFTEYRRFDTIECDTLGPSIDENIKEDESKEKEEEPATESAPLTLIHSKYCSTMWCVPSLE